MMKAGVPLVQAFDIVAEGTDHEKMRGLILDVRADVSSGTGLAGALAKHPLHFDELFCSLVASGEDSGTLEVMLDRVATYKEKTEALKAKIKKAMTYPIATIVVAIVVTGILLVKVVPQLPKHFRASVRTFPASRCLFYDFPSGCKVGGLFYYSVFFARVTCSRRQSAAPSALLIGLTA